MKKKNLRVYKDEFIKLYKEGMSLRQIGELYGVSKSSIKRYIQEDMEIRPKGLTDKEKEKCKEMFLQGYSVYAVSNNLSLGYGTVRRYLTKEFGAITNIGNRKYEHLVPQMKEMYENGFSLTEISKKVGVNRQTIMDYLTELGIKARTYSETSRVYSLNEDVFDVLDNKKAYVLGVIFAKGGIDKSVSTSFIDISVYKENLSLLDIVTETLFNDSYPQLNLVDNTYSLRVSSSKLVSRLNELGLRNNISKTSSNTLHKDLEPFKQPFFDGYLIANTSVSNRSIYISGKTDVIDIVRTYLEEDLKIKLKSKTKTGIHIENNNEIKKLFASHNWIKEKISDFVNSLSDNEKHSWSKIL